MFVTGSSSAKFARRRFVMPNMTIPVTKRAADQNVKKEKSKRPVSMPVTFAAMSIASQVRPTRL